MPNIQFTNFARSQVAVGFSAIATTISVTGGTGGRFPALAGAQYFYLTLENALLQREIVRVTARSGDTLTVVRAQDSTTARAWNAGDIVSLRLNALAIADSLFGALAASNNLSDLANAATARINLGLDSYADLDVTQSFTRAQRGAPVALTDAATVAVDLALANNFTLTLAGNRTLGAPTNQVAGQGGVIVITQSATPYTLAYNTAWKFPGGTAPTLTTTANAVDVLAYQVESATRITCRMLNDVK